MGLLVFSGKVPAPCVHKTLSNHYHFVSDVLTPPTNNVSPSSGTALNKGKAFCNLLIPGPLVCFQ